MKNKVSRILTYRGCFSPPHQGHKDVLCHGFFRGGEDLNIIAAIVYFLDDESVKAKYAEDAGDSESFVLTQSQRIRLFNNGGMYGGLHYCYPNDIGEKWDFQKKLQEEAAKDGFEISFIMLMGPDYLDYLGDNGCRPGSAIVVGTGHADRTDTRAEVDTGLRHLDNHREWKMLPRKDDSIRTLGTMGHSAWQE